MWSITYTFHICKILKALGRILYSCLPDDMLTVLCFQLIHTDWLYTFLTDCWFLLLNWFPACWMEGMLNLGWFMQKKIVSADVCFCYYIQYTCSANTRLEKIWCQESSSCHLIGFALWVQAIHWFLSVHCCWAAFFGVFNHPFFFRFNYWLCNMFCLCSYLLWDLSGVLR